MERTDFLKALAALPFMPAVLERLKPRVSLGFAHDFMPGEDPALRTGPTGPADESWVVEFAGATFTLDIPGDMPTVATAPFMGRMGVKSLDNGWKRLHVTRGDQTYVALVRRGQRGTEMEGAPWSDNLASNPDWWPRRIR